MLECQIDHGLCNFAPEINRKQQTLAAHLTASVPARQCLQTASEISPIPRDARQESRPGNLFHYRTSNSRRECVAVESAALVAALEAADVPVRNQRGERNAPAKPFSKRDDVWLDACMFKPEKSSRSTHSGLNLVEDEKNACASRQVTNPAQECIGCNEYSGLTLDWLQHHGHGVLRDSLLHFLQLVKLYFREARHLWLKQLAPLRLSGCGHCRKRAPMEAMLHGDDLISAIAIFLPPLAGELDCPLDCFRA